MCAYYQTAIHTPTAKSQRKLCLVTWNVLSMIPGMSPDYDLINDSRKSAVIDHELAERSVDIAALQEIRLLEKGSIRELEYTIYWSGKPARSKRQHSVGLAVKNTSCNKLKQYIYVVTLMLIYNSTINTLIQIILLINYSVLGDTH